MLFRNNVKRFSVTSDGKCRKFTEKKSQNILQKLPTACIIPVWTLTRQSVKLKRTSLKEENRMELTYHRKGDYLFPNLTVQDEPMSIGKYGMLRRTYLRENKKNWYQSMLMSGRLNQHLAQIDEQAENRMEELIESLNEKYPAPNKETEQMAWVAHQNNLTAMAEEIVLKELVYN